MRNISNRVLSLIILGLLVVGALGFTGIQSKANAISTQAAVDYFLKLDGIPGESKDAKHKDEIEIESYQWGNNKPGLEQELSRTGGGGGAGKVNVNDIHFTTRISKASPLLMLATAQGNHIKEATLTARKAGKDQQEYLKIKFTDILVSSYKTSGNTGEVPIDQFSINFAKIEFEYSPQKEDGTLDTPIMTGWDFKNNQRL